MGNKVIDEFQKIEKDNDDINDKLLLSILDVFFCKENHDREYVVQDDQRYENGVHDNPEVLFLILTFPQLFEELLIQS
jgi:hypothetical protein